MKEIFQDYVDNAFGEREQAWFKPRQFELNYRRYFPSDPGARVLDIGIGRGEMLSCMRDWGYDGYLGIDISPSTVGFCRSLNLRCYQVGDTAEWLAGHRETFSLITMLDVLEHVKKEETIPLLRALRDALRPDGTLIIQVPNLQAPDGYLHHYNDFTHEVGYIEHSLRQVLMTAGFSDIRCFGFEDSIRRTARERLRMVLRAIYWRYVRLCRRISGNLNPAIIHPVFFAVVRKQQSRKR